MARETQEQRLAKYRDRITASRRWRENQGYVETWRRMIDLYRGRQGTEDSEVDEAVVNLCFSVMNVVVAAVTTQYPKFTVAPNQLGQDDQAVIAEAVLNYAWRHYNFHDEFQQAVIDMCMVGHGWLKVGWRYEEKEQSKTLTASEQFGQVAEQTLQAEQQAAALPPEAAPAAGALPTNEDIAAGVEPTQNVVDVIKDDPFVERVSPSTSWSTPRRVPCGSCAGSRSGRCVICPRSVTILPTTRRPATRWRPTCRWAAPTTTTTGLPMITVG